MFPEFWGHMAPAPSVSYACGRSEADETGGEVCSKNSVKHKGAATFKN